MPSSWTINVGGRTYGPYDDEQMRAFAGEGRVLPQSLVARADETKFQFAADYPELASLFQFERTSSAAPPQQLRKSEVDAQSFGRQDDDSQRRGRIVVFAEMKSRSINGLEEEIFKLGPAYAVQQQVWLLSTDMSVNAIRNLLVQQLGKLDTLFIVDATNDKAAWFNFGPEGDARIRRMWSKQPEAFAKSRAAN